MHEDRNAAAHGLEVRQPYLSAALIAFARAVPLAHCLSADGDAKQVLRLALRGLVPQPILDRRDRLGFAAPAVAWLLAQRPWVESRYRELRSLPFFDGPSFEEAWASLERGGMASWTTAFRLWRWVVLLEWATARNARFE
jgi:asparagine synthase (glutamine-hydrolysing)